MKKKLHIILLMPVIFHVSRNFSFGLTGVSFFMPRSQSVDAARELAGWHPHINKSGKIFYGAFYANPTYTQSVRPERIAQALFGTNQLNISGSQVSTRGNNDWLADYLCLSPTYHSTVHIKPVIRNALVDFNAYVGIKNWYLRAHIPGTWTQWHLHLDESKTGTQSNFPPDYMGSGIVYPGASSFKEALRGTTSCGQMQTPISAGKICGSQTKSGFAELQLALGYNFVNKQNGHVGINIRGSIPSGTKPTSELLFEPIIGNGRHAELGMGFTGRALIWEKDGEQELSFFADLNITHQFKSRQCRSFDFCAPTETLSSDKNCDCPPSFASRYMLLKEFGNDGNYTNKLIPAINISTRPCSVRVDFQADLAAMFGYTYKGFAFDIGYNGWLRSKETIKIESEIPQNRYALKGIQNVAPPHTQATQSHATINGNLLAEQAALSDENPPVFVHKLDPSSAQSPKALTHKFFFYVGNAFETKLSGELRSYVPFLGVGCDIEIEGMNKNSTRNPYKNTLSQWGLWLKGGITY